MKVNAVVTSESERVMAPVLVLNESTFVPVRYDPAGCLLLNVFQSVVVRYPSRVVVADPSLVLIVVWVSSPVFDPENVRFGTLPSPISVAV